MKCVYEGPTADAKDNMLAMMSIAGKHLENVIQALRDQLEQETKNMDVAELLALKNARLIGVSAESVRMSRGAFRRKTEKQ